MKQDLTNKRKDYSQNFMNFSILPESPFELFHIWLENALSSQKLGEPYAGSLATIGKDGFPRTRIILLREVNSEGFIFYTNYNSQKGNSITTNPNVGLSFFWEELEQQIIIKGTAEKVSPEISDDYFHKRPIESQIGACISAQSSVIPFDKNLEQEVQNMQIELEGKLIPRPENWGGFLIKPIEMEFWQGRPSRLHDRIRYKLEENRWTKERLAP